MYIESMHPLFHVGGHVGGVFGGVRNLYSNSLLKPSLDEVN
jgi:hypothetical protein